VKTSRTRPRPCCRSRSPLAPVRTSSLRAPARLAPAGCTRQLASPPLPTPPTPPPRCFGAPSPPHAPHRAARRTARGPLRVWHCSSVVSRCGLDNRGGPHARAFTHTARAAAAHAHLRGSILQVATNESSRDPGPGGPAKQTRQRTRSRHDLFAVRALPPICVANESRLRAARARVRTPSSFFLSSCGAILVPHDSDPEGAVPVLLHQTTVTHAHPTVRGRFFAPGASPLSASRSFPNKLLGEEDPVVPSLPVHIPALHTCTLVLPTGHICPH
jgi:hypothetical protein